MTFSQSCNDLAVVGWTEAFTYDQQVGHLVMFLHGSDHCMMALISLPVEIIENQ